MLPVLWSLGTHLSSMLQMCEMPRLQKTRGRPKHARRTDLAFQRSKAWKLLNLQRWSETKSQHNNNKHWETPSPVLNLRQSSRSRELTWKGSGVLLCLQAACSAPSTPWKAKEKATSVFRPNTAIKSAISNSHGGTDSRGKDRHIYVDLLFYPSVSFIYKGQYFQSSAIL